LEKPTNLSGHTKRYRFDAQKCRTFFDTLNHEYLAVHNRKENLFWATYMATSEDHEGFAEAEKAWKARKAKAARREIPNEIAIKC
jgi:hypothetical protein